MKADALVLFGATGDLAKKKLFPALYDLEDLGELDVHIVGVASSKWTQEVFKENVEQAVRARKPDVDETALSKLLGEIELIVGDYEDPETFVALAEALKDFKLPVIYLAIAPALGLRPDPALGARLRGSVVGWKPFADSVAAMAQLRQHYRLIAMTNAQRWAFAHFDTALGHPFHAAFTTDDTGTEKPDPAFFHQVFAFVETEGASRDDILHVAQSQYHDIGISRADVHQLINGRSSARRTIAHG